MSQVVHNRGHAFSKRFNPAGVYQLPITRLRTHAHLSQLGPLKALIEELSREIRNNRSLLLTTNKSGWPPVSRHPSQEPAALSIGSLPSVAGLDSRLITHWETGSSAGQGGTARELSPHWSGLV